MASLRFYLPPLLSSLFRLTVYIFLGVIPTRLANPVLPALYVAHLLASWLFAPRPLSLNSPDKTNETSPPPMESTFKTLVLSLPTTSRPLRLSNICINSLLLIAAVDFTLTPFLDTANDVMFTRVGAVYPDSVKIVTRYPGSDATEGARLLLAYRETNPNLEPSPWKDGPLINFKGDEDWVDTVTLTGLWPNTSYEYVLSTVNRTILPYPNPPIRFHTFPDPRFPTGNHFKFVASSCVMPNYPYRGPFHYRTIRGFDLLADYLYSPSVKTQNSAKIESLIETSQNMEYHPAVEFLLFLGDFIYADVPVYIGDDQKAYRQLYRRNYQSYSFRKLYERLPILHAYDDHEFINNFGAGGNDSTPPYLNASSAFKIYNSNANYDPLIPGEYYYDFHYGDVAFFVLDTRRYRTEIGAPNRTMLGEVQLEALHSWLSRVNNTSTFKFVVTSVPFTSLWGHDAQWDSWAGFPSEKMALLEVFHSVPNLILLSGDRHEFAAIEFNSPNPEQHPVWEFSTSPLSMFYIPLARTLRLQSNATVQRERVRTNFTENGPRNVSLMENIPSERVIKYIPTGNYKWTTFEVNTKDINRPVLKLEVMIDGKRGFDFEITGTPVSLQSPNGLGTFVSNRIQDIFDKFGINPSKWF